MCSPKNVIILNILQAFIRQWTSELGQLGGASKQDMLPFSQTQAMVSKS